MKLVELTHFHSKKPIFVNPTHVTFVYKKNEATAVEVVGGRSEHVYVVEEVDDVVRKLTA